MTLARYARFTPDFDDIFNSKKMFDSFNLYEKIYFFQFTLHLSLVCVLQLVYDITDESLKEFKEKLTEWILLLTPFHPKVERMFDKYHDIITTTIHVTAIEYVIRTRLARNKLNILYQLSHLEDGNRVRQATIGRYIDNLISSNRLHCQDLLRKAFTKCKPPIELLKERRYLMSLKQNAEYKIIDEFEPSKYLPILRRKYLRIFSISFIYAHGFTILSLFFGLKDISNGHKSIGYKNEHNFLADKILIDFYIYSVFFWMYGVSIISSSILSIIYHRNMLESLNIYVSDLRYTSLRLRTIHNKRPNRMDTIDTSLEEADTRYECNRLALEIYIRLRFLLDSTVMNFISSFVDAVMFIGFTLTFVKVFIRKGPIESIELFLQFFGELGFWNIFLLILAHHHSYCSKKFDRIISMISISIFSEECAIVTSHTRLIWLRFIKEKMKFRDCFGVISFNTFVLNYKNLINIGYVCNFALLYFRNR